MLTAPEQPFQMSQETNKKLAAEAALEFVEPGMIVGVGTGSTTNYFIDALGGIKNKIDGTAAAMTISAYGMFKNSAIKNATAPMTGGINVPPVEAQASTPAA